MTDNRTIEPHSEPGFAPPTPLEMVMGFKVAEETYDKLHPRDQIIVDLLCMGFTQEEIGKLFGISQPYVCAIVRRIRSALAQSSLKMILDFRQDFRRGDL